MCQVRHCKESDIGKMHKEYASKRIPKPKSFLDWIFEEEEKPMPVMKERKNAPSGRG